MLEFRLHAKEGASLICHAVKCPTLQPCTLCLPGEYPNFEVVSSVWIPRALALSPLQTIKQVSGRGLGEVCCRCPFRFETVDRSYFVL
jgi:hypothetical protein